MGVKKEVTIEVKSKPQQERQGLLFFVMLNPRPELVEGQHPRYGNKTRLRLSFHSRLLVIARIVMLH